MKVRDVVLVALAAALAATGLAICLSLLLPAVGSAEAAGWLEALATAGAFSAAIVAAIYVARTLEIERRREDRWVETERRAQASTVAVWPHTESISFGRNLDERTGVAPVTGFGVEFRCRNASDVPITEAEVIAWVDLPNITGGIELGHISLGTVAPGGTPTNHHIQAAASTFVDLGIEPSRLRQMQPPFRLTFSFRDAAGVRWSRSPTGELRERA